MKALRLFAAATALPLLLLPGPALAVSHKEKLATCDFGAKDQKLTGAKRKHFIARCMANENYKPKAEQMKLPEAKPAPKKP
jgi:hypothetical protein